MTKRNWCTLGAAVTMLAGGPAVASDGHKHDPAHAHTGANEEAMKHPAAAQEKPHASYGKQVQGRRVEIAVTKDGFAPAEIPARSGETLNLVVTRKVEKTCATELVQKEQGVHAPLPLGQPVTVTITAPASGQVKFACAHGHITGAVVVR